MLKTITQQRTRVRVRAEGLKPLVALWLATQNDPDDRSAYIKLRLMEQSGVDRCVGCESQLSIEGYRRTETDYCKSESIACHTCDLVFMVDERVIC